MNALEYCRDKAAADGSDNYYSLLTAQSHARDALLALLTLEHELNDVVEQCTDHQVALHKLEFWRAQLSDLERNARHPVALALKTSGAAMHLDHAMRERLIMGTARRIRIAQIQSVDELTSLANNTCGALMRSAAFIEAGCNPDTCEQLGTAIELARQIVPRQRAGLPPHTSVPLPWLREHAVPPQDIDRARSTRATTALRLTHTRFAEAALNAALKGAAPRALRARARLARAQLAIGAKGKRMVTPIEKLWIALRTPRRGTG